MASFGCRDQRGQMSGRRVNRFGLQRQVGRLCQAAVQPVQDVGCGDHPHPRIIALQSVSKHLDGRKRQRRQSRPHFGRQTRTAAWIASVAGQKLAGGVRSGMPAVVQKSSGRGLWKREAARGATPSSSQRVGRARVFEAGGDTQECMSPLAILRPGVHATCPPACPEVFRRQPLCHRERSFRLVDLAHADEAARQGNVRLYHLGPVVERTRRPTNALGILLRAETRKGQHMVGIMTRGLARAQPQDLMNMFDGPLVLTYSSFQRTRESAARTYRWGSSRGRAVHPRALRDSDPIVRPLNALNPRSA